MHALAWCLAFHCWHAERYFVLVFTSPGPDVTPIVMVLRLRQLLFLLIAFAFVGGTSDQLARSAQYAAPMTMAGMPCDMMMMSHGMHNDKPVPPCKGMTPDCIKQMGCVTDAALPARAVSLDVAAHYSDVEYWSAWSTLDDFVREPEPLPPRTI